MTNISRHLAAGGMFIVALALSETAAQAGPTLYFLDTATSQSLTIQDGDANDKNSALGQITWSGSVGTWNISFSSGYLDAAGAAPSLDFSSGIVSGSAPGTLVIRFSENGFGPTTCSLTSAIGGNSAGSVKYSIFADPANTLITDTVPGTAVTVIAPTTVGGSGFNHNDSGSIDLSGLYSLTEEADITLSGAGRTGFDFSLNVAQVPEPSCLSLLALGGLAWAVRRARGRC